MAEIFKLQLEGRNYTFYRASLEEGTIYYILFDEEGSRQSVKIIRMENGRWDFAQQQLPAHIQENASLLISAIARNEAGYSNG